MLYRLVKATYSGFDRRISKQLSFTTWAMLAGLWLYPGLSRAESSPSYPLAESRQLILVISDGWGSTVARLQRFERHNTTSCWNEASDPIKVSIGRSGLGWGRGLHGTTGRRTDPVKREGDGRAPAGIFALPGLFGYANHQSLVARTAKLPYMTATPDLLCVDDASSALYNLVIDRRRYPLPDWNSYENMLRKDNQYSWGVIVAHNTPPKPNVGSCIFMHVWKGEGEPTEGCTAGSAPDIAAIFLWLRAEASPLLVQLPKTEYLRLKSVWSLP